MRPKELLKKNDPAKVLLSQLASFSLQIHNHQNKCFLGQSIEYCSDSLHNIVLKVCMCKVVHRLL